jgi:hypothetical protein
MNAKILIPLLLAVVAIAGCVGQGEQKPTAGLGAAILSFAPSQDSVYTNKSVTLTMTIENQGDYIINKTFAFAYLMGSNLKNTSDSDPDMWTTTPLNRSLPKDLKPADPSRQIPADQANIKWTVTAPTGLSRGQSRTDTFIGRFYYLYNTTVDTTAWIYSESEAAAERAKGNQLTPPTSSYSYGPLEVTVSYAPTNPVISDNTFTMFIKIKNVGGGVPFNPTSDIFNNPESPKLEEDELNKVYINITDPSGKFTIPGDCQGVQELLPGKETPISCDITMSGITAPKTGFSPKITISYGYYIDAQTQITVQGK